MEGSTLGHSKWISPPTRSSVSKRAHSVWHLAPFQHFPFVGKSSQQSSLSGRTRQTWRICTFRLFYYCYDSSLSKAQRKSECEQVAVWRGCEQNLGWAELQQGRDSRKQGEKRENEEILPKVFPIQSFPQYHGCAALEWQEEFLPGLWGQRSALKITFSLLKYH